MNDTTFAPTPERPFILVGGSLQSTLDDMAVFGQMHLNDGEYNGKQCLSVESVTEQRRLQIPEERLKAPVFGVDGQSVVGAIWISGPAKRLPKSRFRELGGQVKAAGNQVSQLIRKLG